MSTIYVSLKDELEQLSIIRNSPYQQIYKDGDYFFAELYDGTVTLATTMEQLRKKLEFIAKTEIL